MRRQFQRLDEAVNKEKQVKGFMLDGKSCKIMVIRKLQLLKITSPSKLLVRLRDAYIDRMLLLAGNVTQLNNGNVFLR